MIFNNCSVIHLFYDQCDTYAVRPEKNRQMSIKLPKMISLEKLKILTPLQKFPKNVNVLGKLIVAKSY